MTVSGVKKHEQIKATGASYLAAPCANCKRQLAQLMEHHRDSIAIGGVHDLLSRAILVDGRLGVRKAYQQ